ncbi:MAG: hypothetical protein J6I68_01275 [Butyrivibrio sp.]|uniref:hypothetical protein n=1 Tax=Butyrivibrio sp. TaxID=28121 RepID=UPI001B6A3F2B|nr:hypothetical protein [Butyrivibrio sp.]MBP3781860.1 hypothetical protein [Butyrivibrio sp.]
MATAKTTKTATTKKTASTAKKTTTASKKTASTAKKTTSASKKATSIAKKTTSTGTSVKVSATEKKLLELYRAADADTKKAAMALLKGEKSQLGGVLDEILKNKTIMNTVTSFFK